MNDPLEDLIRLSEALNLYGNDLNKCQFKNECTNYGWLARIAGKLLLICDRCYDELAGEYK